MLAWLNTLHDEFGIQVRFFDVSAEMVPGQVRVLNLELA
ncbi:MAG: hypothetical protein ACRDC9_07885 [Plesiomonas shigelloides]